MKIAAYQMSMEVTPKASRAKIKIAIETLSEKVDLFVLPEMFTTGFSMDSEKICEPSDGATLLFLKEMAQKHNMAITGSVATKEIGENGEQNHYNRMYFVYPSGEYCFYDKHHLFRMGDEHNHYKAGEKRVVVEYMGCRILLQVCYDLRFPVFSRNRNDYDMAIYVAAWPASRVAAWNKLLLARAIENQAFIISSNHTGTFDGLEYSGGTHIIDYKGEYVSSATPSTQEVIIGEVDLEALKSFRTAFPAYMDCDAFEMI